MKTSRQVIAASASCCAEVEFIEIEYSEKSYAAPKMLYRDGADLLSEIREAVIDSGSTLTLTNSPLNCRDFIPVDFKIQLAKKKITMNAQYKCIKTCYVRDKTQITDNHLLRSRN